MTTDRHEHLDDDALSLVVDGETAAADLAGCPTCSARLAALEGARAAVAAAVVPPLPPGVLDELVGRALAAPAEEAPSSALSSSAPVGVAVPRRPRRSTPPPAWLAAAAAAIVVLVGVGGLLRTLGDTSRAGDDSGAAMSKADDGLDAGAGGASSAESADAKTMAAAAPAVDVVTSDLGAIDDEDGLVAALAGGPGGAPVTTVPAAPSASTSGSGARTGGATAGGAPAADVATPTEATGDRAQCRDEAERLGAGRLGTLLSTATVRWQGQPAEVLVYALAAPADGVSRQALVLARPGCSVVADPRF
jgi:hypothetical protein